jgi:hypothetical protein
MSILENETVAPVVVDVKVYEWLLHQHGGLDAVLLDIEAERMWEERWAQFHAMPDGTTLVATTEPAYTVVRVNGQWRSPAGALEVQVHVRNRFGAGALEVQAAPR